MLRDLYRWLVAIGDAAPAFHGLVIGIAIMLGVLVLTVGLIQSDTQAALIGASGLGAFILFGPGALVREIRKRGGTEPTAPPSARIFLVIDEIYQSLRPVERTPSRWIFLWFAAVFMGIATYFGITYGPMGVPFFGTIAVLLLWAFLHPTWANETRFPPAIPAILGGVLVIQGCLGFAEAAVLTPEVQAASVEDQFVDVVTTRDRQKEFKSVHVRLENGDLLTVHSGELWRLMRDEQVQGAVVRRTPILHELLDVRVGDKTYDERWDSSGGPLYFATFAVAFGVLLLAVGAVMRFWVPLKAYFWDSATA